MAHYRRRTRLLAEMNVVPYIDVMLVLLVIFMITSPMLSLTEGVEVELPRASGEPITQAETGPVMITVDAQGGLYLTYDEVRDEAVTPDVLLPRTVALLQADPQRAVLVRGDTAVSHGKIVELMAHLKAAGVAKVGLVTQPATGGGGTP